MGIRYSRTSTGREVGFVINDKEVAIEAKASSRVSDAQAKDLMALAEYGPVRRRIIVCMERQRRDLKDAYGTVSLMPRREFLSDLWAGNVIKE